MNEEKLAYTRPELVMVGQVSDVTEGTANGNTTDVPLNTPSPNRNVFS